MLLYYNLDIFIIYSIYNTMDIGSKINYDDFTKKTPVAKNNYKIDKMTILLVLIVFTFYNKLSFILWDIGKALIYIVLFLFGISYLNKPFAEKIKKILNEIINIGSNNFIYDAASTVSKGVSKLLKSKPKIETYIDIDNNRNNDNNSFISTNRSLSNHSVNNIRKIDRY